MLPWIKIFWLALQLALWAMKHLERQQAISEGEANAARAMLDGSNAIISNANKLRSEPLPVQLDDPFNRDGPIEDNKKDVV